MLNKYEEALSSTLKNEGGVDTNSVLGSGISNFGVTQRAWDAYSTKNKLPIKPVTVLSPQEVRKFYSDEYFVGPKINMLPTELAAPVFDFAVNSGPQTAIKHLQGVLGVSQDGIIGPQTLNALTGKDSNIVINKLLDSRQMLLDKLVKEKPEIYKKFEKGWRTRVEGYRPRSSNAK